MPDDLDSKISAAEERVREADRLFALRLRDQQDDDRSVIAKIIITAFVSLVIIVVLGIIGGAYFLDWNDIAEPVKALTTILGSVMLPVVTLVIGYYFGSK